MTEIKSRQYKWGSLAIRADWSHANSTIWAYVDGGSPILTPFQVASFSHSWKRALSGVNRWLASNNPSR